jgi:electron transfer flavoprotein beta subunit
VGSLPLDIVVFVKHIYDENQLKVDSLTGDVDFKDVPGKVSTFDRNSVEAALQLKHQFGGSVTTLTVGPEEAMRSIREALAMGADRGVLVKVSSTLDMDVNEVCECIQVALREIQPWNLLLCAEGGADTYTSALPGMLAEILNIPYLSYLRSITVEGNDVLGERLLERSVVSVRAHLPAIASVVSEINTPRIPTLLQIMAASKKEVKVIPVEQNAGLSRFFLIGRLSGQTRERKKTIFEGSTEEVTERLLDSLIREGLL